MWNTRLPILAAAITLLALSGCASGGSSGSYDPATTGVIELAVTNDHDRSIRMYLIDGQAAIPLGSVSSRARRTFRVDVMRLRTAGSLRLAADPVGPSPRVHLPAVEVATGQAVDFTLTNDLRFATFRVRSISTGASIVVRRSSVS